MVVAGMSDDGMGGNGKAARCLVLLLLYIVYAWNELLYMIWLVCLFVLVLVLVLMVRCDVISLLLLNCARSRWK